MSYIELINKAWELREQGIISVHEHDLYNYLLHKCNRLNWKNPFSQPTEIICAVLGINRNALTNRRNRLKQAGLITFKDGTAKSKPAEYTIEGIAQDTLPDTQGITLLYTLTHTLTDTNTKDKKRPDQTKGKEKKRKEIFRIPSLSQVSDYCRQRANDVDAQTFLDFYEAKGWMIGKNPMKDWRAALRTWEGKQLQPKQNGFKHNAANHQNNKPYEIF